jgi:hypothetical protein
VLVAVGKKPLIVGAKVFVLPKEVGALSLHSNSIETSVAIPGIKVAPFIWNSTPKSSSEPVVTVRVPPAVFTNGGPGLPLVCMESLVYGFS